MLKQKIKEIIDRYENANEFLTASDIQEEIENVICNEPYDSANEDIECGLQNALRDYIIAQRESEKYGGRIPDGSDEFIAAVEQVIGYKN